MKDENGIKLTSLSIEFVIARVKALICEAETDTISSNDELIAIGKTEGLREVMPLLYALKKHCPHLTSAMHSDGEDRASLEKAGIPGDEETFNNSEGW